MVFIVLHRLGGYSDTEWLTVSPTLYSSVKVVTEKPSEALVVHCATSHIHLLYVTDKRPREEAIGPELKPIHLLVYDQLKNICRADEWRRPDNLTLNLQLQRLLSNFLHYFEPYGLEGDGCQPSHDSTHDHLDAKFAQRLCSSLNPHGRTEKKIKKFVAKFMLDKNRLTPIRLRKKAGIDRLVPIYNLRQANRTIQRLLIS